MAGDDDDDDDDEEKRMASARDCGRRHDCRRSRWEVLFIIRARSFVDVGSSSRRAHVHVGILYRRQRGEPC